MVCWGMLALPCADAAGCCDCRCGRLETSKLCGRWQAMKGKSWGSILHQVMPPFGNMRVRLLISIVSSRCRFIPVFLNHDCGIKLTDSP